MGVEFRLNTEIGTYHYRAILADYDAVFMGMGTYLHERFRGEDSMACMTRLIS